MLPDRLLFDNDLFFMGISRMLTRKNSVTLRPKGNSMFPFIVDGRDRIVLQKAERLKVGDIVLAHIPGKTYVLHRIYRIDNDGLTLMGDDNLHDTEHCRREDVLAYATSIVRNGHIVSCHSFRERILAFCWRKLLPVRRYMLFVCRHLVKKKS